MPPGHTNAVGLNPSTCPTLYRACLVHNIQGNDVMKMLSWVALAACLVTITASGCSGGGPDTASAPSETNPPPATSATESATEPTSTTDTTADGSATTAAAAPEPTPASADATATTPATTATTAVNYTEADYAVWTQSYSPEVFYANTTSGNVNVRSGPSTETTVQASLEPGNGGYVKTCTTALDWCQIEYGTDTGTATGWVSMSLFGGFPDGQNPTGGETASSSAQAKQANATCEVWGLNTMTPRFEGDCIFNQAGGDGSFSIESPSGLIDGYSIISVTLVAPGQAEVRGLTADGINSRWGEAIRVDSDPACWAGGDFTICAR